MYIFQNCRTIKGAPYFTPHTIYLDVLGTRGISIEFENEFNRGFVQRYYVEKLKFKMIGTATDRKGNIFNLYANTTDLRSPDLRIIATADEKESWRY